MAVLCHKIMLYNIFALLLQWFFMVIVFKVMKIQMPGGICFFE